jgi:hypothetical protein
MRKIAIVAMLAIVAAMVPLSTASSQPTPGSLDGVGTLMVVNSTNSALDLWVREDGAFQKFDLSGPSKTELQFTTGDHAFRVCGPASTDENCTGGVLAPASTPASLHIGSNDIINFVIGDPGLGATVNSSRVYNEQNVTDKTETDHAALTMFSTIPAPVDVCVNGNHVLSLPAGNSFDYAEFDAKDGEGQEVKFFIPGAGAATNCALATVPAAATVELNFPPGSNTVINRTVNATCTSDCGYQIFPGEEAPNSSQQVDAFCAVVLEAANITPWLQDLFDEIEVGNEDTYPSSDRVEKVLTRIAELLEKGNQTAPADIRQVWLRATAGFVETGRLAAVDFDLTRLSQSDLRCTVDGIEHPGEDDSEEAADTAALTAWVTTNCFGAVEAEPSFTG